MVIQETKTTKRLRLAQCVLFLIEIVFLTLPYVGGEIDGAYRYFTCIDLVFKMTQYESAQLNGIAIIALIFVIIPVAGFFTSAFDKTRNIKNVVGIIGSGIGVCAITFMIGGEALALGSMLSLLLYLVIFFISVLAVFGRLMPATNENKR